MPDITMCSSNDCYLSESCYRHVDSGTVWWPNQSYTEFDHMTHDCDYYLGGEPE